jgi:hypothetical protein
MHGELPLIFLGQPLNFKIGCNPLKAGKLGAKLVFGFAVSLLAESIAAFGKPCGETRTFAQPREQCGQIVDTAKIRG